RIIQHAVPGRAPISVFPFAPIAIGIAPVGIAVAAGVNVIALLANKAFAPAIDHSTIRAPRNSGGVSGAVSETLRTGPAVTALDLRRTPTAVHATPLPRLRISAGPRVKGLRCAARAVRSIGERSPRIGSGAWVVSRAKTNSTIGSVNSARSPVDSGVRVVPGAITISSKIRVVAAAPVIGRVIPACAPHSAAPANHHPHVSAISSVSDPIGFIILDLYISHGMRRRAGGNLIDLIRNALGQRPWPLRRSGYEPNSLITHVVAFVELDNFLISIHCALQLRSRYRFKFRFTLIDHF